MKLGTIWAAPVFGLLLAWAIPGWSATVELSGSTALTNNSEYDRNPSIINDGSDYWLFWTKGDDTSTAGVRGSYNPDGDNYVVYYKTASTIAGLAGAAETKLALSESERPAGFDQRVVSATVFGGDIYAFVSSGQSGTTRGLHYYRYSGTWSGPTTLIADGTTRGGHVNVTSDSDRVYIVWESSDGSSDCYTWDGVILSSKIDISNDNQPKVTRMASTLYVVSLEDGSGDVEVYSAATGVAPIFAGHSTAITGVGLYDPTIFNDGTNLYVVTAPYDGGNDQQYLIQAEDEDADGTWAVAKTISLGGYQNKATATWTYWWDYWPIGYHDGSDVYVFFTTEVSSPTFSDGEIHVVKMDWDLANNHYLYIQNGIDQASSGDTVNVAAGTYVENLTVDKTLTLAGAGQENTLILPAVSSPGCGSASSLCGGGGYGSSNLILVAADDVTVHDLTIDGDNPALTSGIVRDGADLDARNGIIENFYVGVFNNLEVYNVTTQNIYLRAIYPATGGSGFNIHNNTVENVQGESQSIGIMVYAGSGIIAENTITNVNDGIAGNWSSGTQFLNNVVSDCGSGVHTDNAGRSGGVADLLQGNEVSNCDYGVFTFEPGIAPTVQGNIISGCKVGLNHAGGGSTGALFIGNSVDGGGDPNSVGVYITTSLYGWGADDVSATFTENGIVNTGQGFLLQDKACNSWLNSTTGCTTDADCQALDPNDFCEVGNSLAVSANCNAVGTNGIGALTEALDDPNDVVFYDNIIASNTVGVDATAVPSGSVDFRSNYWGCAAGPGNPGCDTVTANVNASSPLAAEPACATCVCGAGDADCDTVCDWDDNCPDDANPAQEDMDLDGDGDACDPDDTAGLSIRVVRVVDPLSPGQKWIARGELDVTSTPDFRESVAADGLTIFLYKQDGGGDLEVVDSFTFTGDECVEKRSTIVCKDLPTRSVLRLRERVAVEFFKVRLVRKLASLTVPTLAETPLAVGIQTADLVDRTDEVSDDCRERTRVTFCRELP